MKRLLDTHDLILMEAAVVERLRRSVRVDLHPTLVHATLLYDRSGRKELRKTFESYIAVAQAADLPILLCTPTWRANRERIRESDIDPKVNREAVLFLNEIRGAQGAKSLTIKIGGLIGCKNDCYRAEEGLPPDESERFHSWQIKELARAGVDFLIAETLPSVHEAVGIARSMAATGSPYIISFVINREGRVLDGSTLSEGISKIDSSVARNPAGYMVNCAHPTFLCPEGQPDEVFTRLIGYQANASSLNHADLDGSTQQHVDDISQWGSEMLNLNRRYGVKILGGCCGTGADHLRYLATNWRHT